VFVELDHQPESTLREALTQVGCLHEAVRENPDRIVLVRSTGDCALVEDASRVGLLLALEGAEPLGYDVATADVFYELGVRMVSLTWNRRNQFADGVAETGGLSRLGERLVDRLVERGVVIDLAHASRQTFDEILERAAGSPVLVSHAACRTVNDHPRNLTDEQLSLLADAGGLLCLMLLPLTIDLERPTIDRAIDHLEHAASVMGADRIGLGGDFTRRLGEVLPPLPDLPDALLPPDQAFVAALEGLAGPEDYPSLAAALHKRGWDDAGVAAVMGRNLLAFLRRALPIG
jgi:membrane dipeptidase